MDKARDEGDRERSLADAGRSVADPHQGHPNTQGVEATPPRAEHTTATHGDQDAPPSRPARAPPPYV